MIELAFREVLITKTFVPKDFFRKDNSGVKWYAYNDFDRLLPLFGKVSKQTSVEIISYHIVKEMYHHEILSKPHENHSGNWNAGNQAFSQNC